MPARALPSTTAAAGVDADRERLEHALRARVQGEVRFDAGTRAAYSTDASNYRQVPIAVVVPRTVDDAVAAISVCSAFGVPVLSRGGGTSLAGECCNVAVVIDWSKYCHRILSIDPVTRRAIVEPGVVLDQLNAAAAEHGLMFGPKPATHAHCTLGGMIGNNSCGASAQAYGKTADNIVRLEVVCYDGTRFWAGAGDEEHPPTGREAQIRGALRELADEFGGDIRHGFPDIPRRVSGYNLDDLLPERGPDLARALCGSESTLVTVLRAEVSLVPVVPARSLVVLGYPSIADAADAVPSILPHDPHLLEGMDGTVLGNQDAGDDQGGGDDRGGGIGRIPDGDAWLLVELAADDAAEALGRARDLVDDLGRQPDDSTVAIIDDEGEQGAVMAVREAALAAAAWDHDGNPSWAGWEDAAVPPARLGDYLRDFRTLLDEFGYGKASLYGHFGQGCVHTRIPFDLTSSQGVAQFRRFVVRAAHLVADHGGSLSGEHGDGQARGELLPIMYGERVMAAFRRMKEIFDPTGRMNPGKVIDADPVDAHLRLGAGYTPLPLLHQQFAYPHDKGSFQNATLRCVGVGACRNHDGGVMCPSYRATGEEEHSTRGRARMLYEMLRGGPGSASEGDGSGSVSDGWRSNEVRDALDLCLSCKGCKSDCPVGVDMATYKAEFLWHHYRGRIRPMAHYTMGWLPLWARFAQFAPWLVNAVTHAPVLGRAAAQLGGLEPDRPIPYFAAERFTHWYRRRGPRSAGARGDVLLWPDTFTDNLHPGVARAAVTVLEDAGYRVIVPRGELCCGLTWISTGQLGIAKTVLRRTARVLAPYLQSGMPLVGLEPSCTAVFRSDGPELLPGEDGIRLLSERTRTLAEVLCDTDGWRPPHIDRAAVVQPHCHQHAVLGFDADATVLESAGVDTTVVGGCCGLAGNFGFEKGHLDVSVAVAETEFLPAVRAADDEALVVADGFSCRTQLEQAGVGRQAVHLAELLAAGLDGVPDRPRPEYAFIRRPGRPQAIPAHRRGVRPFVDTVRDPVED